MRHAVADGQMGLSTSHAIEAVKAQEVTGAAWYVGESERQYDMMHALKPLGQC
jgi:hypothetical protein